MPRVSLVLIVGLAIVSVCHSFPKTQKKLKESATLTCREPCSGVAEWRRGAERVHQCEGPAEGCDFRVPQVNFSTRGIYSVFCGDTETVNCRQFLQLIPPEFEIELDAGDRLRLDLHIPKAVIIEFRRPGNSSTVQLCHVDGRHYQCHPEYQQRVLIVGNDFFLFDMMPTDSGNYSIREEDQTMVSSTNTTVGERSSRVKFPPSAEKENHDLKQIFISTVNDFQDSWIWKDGYQKGMKYGVLIAGTVIFLMCVCVHGALVCRRWKAFQLKSFDEKLRNEDNRHSQPEGPENRTLNGVRTVDEVRPPVKTHLEGPQKSGVDGGIVLKKSSMLQKKHTPPSRSSNPQIYSCVQNNRVILQKCPLLTCGNT